MFWLWSCRDKLDLSLLLIQLCIELPLIALDTQIKALKAAGVKSSRLFSDMTTVDHAGAQRVRLALPLTLPT